MATHFFKTLLAGTALLAAVSAQAEPFKVVNLDSGSFLMNDQGITAKNQSDSSSAPSLFDTNGNETAVGTLDYAPSSLNLTGDLVGINSVYGDDGNYTYYFFYTKKGEESAVLTSYQTSSYNSGSISINNARRIAVLLSDKIEFFNESTKIGEVSPGANTLFDTSKSVFVLSNGDALAPVLIAGTPRWARVSSGATVTVLSETVIPGSATVYKILSNGKVLFSDSDGLKTTDLSGAASAVTLPANANKHLSPIDINASGQIIAYDTRNSGTSRLANIYEVTWLVQPDVQPINLTCMFPNKQRLHVDDTLAIADNGIILASLYDRKGTLSSNKALLEPTGSTHANNYCVTTSMRVVGNCKKYFKGLTQTKTMPKSLTCQFQVTVKNPQGKPLPGQRVVTSSYGSVANRGKTDSNGQLTFSVKTPDPDSYASMEIIAPYGSSTWLSNSATAYFNY